MPPAEGALAAGARVALVLGGGNALGAYHAGLYEALHEAGLEPEWVVGTSIGAVTGAIIAGNPPERRVEQLRELWRPERAGAGWPLPWDAVPDSWRRSGAVVETLLAGRSGLFGPLGSSAWSAMSGSAAAPALYDTRGLAETLARLVDFDLLNSGPCRFAAAMVDVESGDELVVDTARERVLPDHVRASASLLTTFPALDIGGRLLGDGGLSMNLPLDPVMADHADRPTLCIASDLLPLAGRRPGTLGETIGRMQDLIFAAQSARTIVRWQALFAERVADDAGPSITLALAAYGDQEREVAGKAMDFSPRSVRARWDSGRADGEAIVARLRDGSIAVGEPGLTVHRV